MRFMTTSQKVYELGANATGMSTAKNHKIFLNLEKQRRSSNTIKKLVVDDKEIADDKKYLRDSFQNTGTKDCDRNGKIFSVMLIF